MLKTVVLGDPQVTMGFKTKLLKESPFYSWVKKLLQ